MTLDIDDLERKARSAIAQAFKRAHRDSCYPDALDGESERFADTVLALAAEPFDPPTTLALIAEVRRLREAVAEIETICREDNATFRKRMGTRVGNCLVVASAALTSGAGHE